MSRIVHNIRDVSNKLTYEPVAMQHDMASSGMFDDVRLAELIDIYRKAGPSHYTLGTLDSDGVGEKWQNGVLAEMPGKQLLEAIKTGRLWLQLQHMHEIAPDYHQLSIRAYQDMYDDGAGFKPIALTSNLLISSPAARVLCHIDCKEVTLFHIRGRKRFWLYDLTEVADKTVESIILREQEEEIPYTSDWDKNATCVDLEPGQAMNFPHFWPHRIDNIDGLNVSLQTEFYSPKGLKELGVRYANGIMRRRLGITPGPVKNTGLATYVKAFTGLALKKLGVNKPAERKIISRFILDPASPGAVRQLSANEMQQLAK